MSLKQELYEIFGEETVQLAVAQEVLAERFIQTNTIEVRKTLERFTSLEPEAQKNYVCSFSKEMSRAIICALLLGTASKVVLDLGSRAIDDKRRGRAVLGGRMIQR